MASSMSWLPKYSAIREVSSASSSTRRMDKFLHRFKLNACGRTSAEEVHDQCDDGNDEQDMQHTGGNMEGDPEDHPGQKKEKSQDQK